CVDILSLCVLPVHAYILSRNNKGRWTKDEHERFLSVAGQLVKSKENWKWISQVVVTTRSPAQVRTHAQKYFRKIGQGLPFPDEPYTNDRVNDCENDEGEGEEEEEEKEGEEEEEEEEEEETVSHAAGGGTTLDGAGRYPLPSTALSGGQMSLAGAPVMVSPGPSRIMPSHNYEDGGGAASGGSFHHAVGAPALPSLCFPYGVAPGFAPGQGGQDSRLDPHVAAAAASAAATETAAGAAALGHDLDGGMFLPSGGGGASSTLPPLWGDASVAYAGGASGGGSFSMTDDSGGGFPLDNWPSELDP
ncbi:unnamed protein product, partial [Ectocarpus fasciculatus]